MFLNEIISYYYDQIHICGNNFFIAHIINLDLLQINQTLVDETQNLHEITVKKYKKKLECH